MINDLVCSTAYHVQISPAVGTVTFEVATQDKYKVKDKPVFDLYVNLAVAFCAISPNTYM